MEGRHRRAAAARRVNCARRGVASLDGRVVAAARPEHVGVQREPLQQHAQRLQQRQPSRPIEAPWLANSEHGASISRRTCSSASRPCGSLAPLERSKALPSPAPSSSTTARATRVASSRAATGGSCSGGDGAVASPSCPAALRALCRTAMMPSTVACSSSPTLPLPPSRSPGGGSSSRDCISTTDEAQSPPSSLASSRLGTACAQMGAVY
jgi:hypothetical protein